MLRTYGQTCLNVDLVIKIWNSHILVTPLITLKVLIDIILDSSTLSFIFSAAFGGKGNGKEDY